ncbi:hypothetical protein [Loigolactobacillus binensis]|uniref:Uncharacterized protein n=1 Tax=Loigolactobacillus binensis TaxID=2559922 RepID=A0ABW3EF62_9LACO|nr:hypothetical protein [Loigolactobacillus binensis]
MVKQGRYYQPQDTKDAMRYVEKLFNQYKDAPLTDELLRYNQKLMTYLTVSVVNEAQQNGQPERAKTAQAMAAALAGWVQIKAAGKPFFGEMRHFKIVDPKQHVHIKNRRVKGHKRQPTMRKMMR